jgi:hypothetical protein
MAEAPPVEEEEEDENVYTVIEGKKQFRALLENYKLNRFIFMKNGREKKAVLRGAQELGAMIGSMRQLGVELYEVDLARPDHLDALAEFLESRNSTMKKEELITHSFLLANKFNDAWVQDLNLIDEFRNELQFYYKFFEGPRKLSMIEHLLCANGGRNDYHLVSFVKDISSQKFLQ